MSTQSAPASLDFLGCRARILSDAASSGGLLGLIEMDAPAGDRSPLHVHHAEDEGFYVLDGEVMLFMPGEALTLRAGDFFLAPRGIPHTYEVGERPARWLVTSTPAHFEAFVAEVAAAGEAATDPERIGAIAAQHQIEILGPPGARP